MIENTINDDRTGGGKDMILAGRVFYGDRPREFPKRGCSCDIIRPSN